MPAGRPLSARRYRPRPRVPAQAGGSIGGHGFPSCRSSPGAHRDESRRSTHRQWRLATARTSARRAATNSRKRRAAEHILRRGGETRNIEFSDFAVRAAGEQAGRRVKVPAQCPRPPERFEGGIPVGEYLIAIGEHGAVAHLDQCVMPGIARIGSIARCLHRSAARAIQNSLSIESTNAGASAGKPLRGASSSVSPA